MRSRQPSPGPAALGLLATALVATALLGLASCRLPSAPTDRYAIVIGIADYPDPTGLWNPGSYDDLSYTVNDASDMAAALTAGGWQVEGTITNKNATKADIRTAIMNLGNLASPDSSVLVYYSGHGSSIGETAYIIPYDGLYVSGGGIYENTSNWVSPAELDSWLNALPCNNKLVILDSCYSGGFVADGAAVDAAPQNYGPYDGGVTAGTISTAFANASRLLASSFSSASDPGILTISAAGSQEFSYDDGGSQHGAFTNWLLKAATDSAADIDGNHLVTATEALAYAKAKLLSNWNTLYYSSPGAIDQNTGLPIMYADFLPRISGGSGDLVLYDKR